MAPPPPTPRWYPSRSRAYDNDVSVELKRIETDFPARMDRLPGAHWHWLIVIGLGTLWILDGREVTIVGAMSKALKSTDNGPGLTNSDVGMAGATSPVSPAGTSSARG